MNRYKVGDWLINKHSKQICKITGIFDSLELCNVDFVYSLNTDKFVRFSELVNNYAELNLNCPVAQVLYTNNSNKAVTNEKNEK